MLHFFGSE